MGILRCICIKKKKPGNFSDRNDLNRNLNKSERNIIFNSRKDDFFGTGERGDGQNIMGRILMKIRRKEQRKEMKDKRKREEGRRKKKKRERGKGKRKERRRKEKKYKRDN